MNEWLLVCELEEYEIWGMWGDYSTWETRYLLLWKEENHTEKVSDILLQDMV